MILKLVHFLVGVDKFRDKFLSVSMITKLEITIKVSKECNEQCCLLAG